MMAEAFYQVEPVLGKGLGAVAVKNICIGQRILAAIPLFTVSDNFDPAELERTVFSLSSSKRTEFMQLTPAVANSSRNLTYSIFVNNAVAVCMGDSSSQHLAVSSEVSRFNHDCSPNAVCKWNELLGSLTIHVIKDIRSGDEITISYTDLFDCRENRRKSLKRRYGFDCFCNTCLTTNTRSDDRRIALRMRREEFRLLFYSRSFSCANKIIRESIELAREEGLDNADVLLELYHHSYELNKHWGKHQIARNYLLLAKEQAELANGIDSAQVNRYFRLTIPALKLPKLVEPSCHLVWQL